jgi:hypothetical protein
VKVKKLSIAAQILLRPNSSECLRGLHCARELGQQARKGFEMLSMIDDQESLKVVASVRGSAAATQANA